MNAEQVLRVREGLVAREFDDETVVLDLHSSTYLTSNPAATTIWRVLESGATRSQIVTALLAEFDVTPEQAATDVHEFIEDCARRGYLSASEVSSDTSEVDEP
jgi:hypothetical protein